MTIGSTASTSRKSTNREAEASRSIRLVVDALRANPLVAPYPIQVTWRGDRILLSGKVGTREVYDIAIRTMIDIGVPFRESLVIDTAETYKVALAATMNSGVTGNYPTQTAASLPYVYPPPLFGRLDDPFFGFEPPAVSFPAYGPNGLPNGDQVVPGVGVAPRLNSPLAKQSNSSQVQNPEEPIKGKATISMDEDGRVLLQGIVASEEIKRVIEQEAASVPGVSQVINELAVEGAAENQEQRSPFPQPNSQPSGNPSSLDSNAPPPPAPHPPADAIDLGLEAPRTSTIDSSLIARVSKAISQRLPDDSKTVKAAASEDLVILSGRVPTAYEAMIAYRAAQQTPGVGAVVDRLEFTLPDDGTPNPLLQKGEAQDIQPYLIQQIRKNLGEVARVDRAVLDGKVLQVQGSVLREEDQKRVAATLRSMPILRGFEIEPHFLAN